MKQVKELRRNIRQYLEENNQLYFDTRISHLLPQKNKRTARVFLFLEISENEKCVVSSPYAIIDIDMFDGTILNCQVIVEDTTQLEWIEYTPISCTNVYDDVLEIFAISDYVLEIIFKDKKEFDKDLKDKLNRLKELFDSVIPKELFPIYYLYGKDFFDWLKE